MNPAPEILSSAAGIELPSEGELIFSPSCSVLVSAPAAARVEVSLDAGPWQPCRRDGGRWRYEWTGYGSGGHVICARAVGADGSLETLRPRALRVTLRQAQAGGLQESAGADGSGIERALDALRGHDVRFVQLWFTSLSGKPWRLCVPIDQVNSQLFRCGLTQDGLTVAPCFGGFLTLLPDPRAVYRDPLAAAPTAAVFCDLLEPPDESAAGLGVRQALRCAVETLGRHEEGLTITLGAEPEFLLREGSGQPAPEPVVWDFMCALACALEEAGIKCEGFRFGPAAGQGRVQMRWAHPVETADHIVLYRWFAEVLAQRRGLRLSFAPAPGACATSMPTHHTLWLGAANAFHDPQGWRQTSSRCRLYTGGLIRHAPALCALLAPSPESYPIIAGADLARLKPCLHDEPEALCRIPERHQFPAGRRLKFRAGNAQANPYLALAALILAGADGLRSGIQPLRAPAAALPPTLGKALDALDADRAFLKEGGFTDKLIDAWIADRRRQQPL